MTRRMLFLFSVFFLLLAMPVLAQEKATGAVNLGDPKVIAAIMLGFGGVTVLGLTEMAKRLLKASGILAYVISAGVSLAATAFYFLTTGTFTWFNFALYSVLVFLEANGFYKAIAKPA